MTNKKQSSIEWYIEQNFNLEVQHERTNMSNEEYTFAYNMILQQAKAMHKEEHAKTWDKSMDNLDVRGGNIVRAWDDFDDYYTKTFGGGE